MKIKVCGLKEPGNIAQVMALSPDYMGFVFYGPSPRFVNELPVEGLKNIPATITKTAVLVNETAEYVNELIAKYNFDAIQLHGSENPQFCNAFKGRVKVIKAFGLDTGFDFEQLDAYVGKVDVFLFDAKTTIHGGSGNTFDWGVLGNYKLNVPFFLSGGISLDNLEEIKRINHPQFYGVDLNSKFEVEPGIKSIKKLEKAFDIIKQFNSHEIRS